MIECGRLHVPIKKIKVIKTQRTKDQTVNQTLAKTLKNYSEWSSENKRGK